MESEYNSCECEGKDIFKEIYDLLIEKIGTPLPEYLKEIRGCERSM